MSYICCSCSTCSCSDSVMSGDGRIDHHFMISVQKYLQVFLHISTHLTHCKQDSIPLFLMTLTVSHPGLWRTRKDQNNFPRPCLITPVLFCPGPGETRSDADWLINMMMVLLFITLYILTAEYYSQQFIIAPWDMTMSR